MSEKGKHEPNSIRNRQNHRILLSLAGQLIVEELSAEIVEQFDKLDI